MDVVATEPRPASRGADRGREPDGAYLRMPADAIWGALPGSMRSHIRQKVCSEIFNHLHTCGIVIPCPWSRSASLSFATICSAE